MQVLASKKSTCSAENMAARTKTRVGTHDLGLSEDISTVIFVSDREKTANKVHRSISVGATRHGKLRRLFIRKATIAPDMPSSMFFNSVLFSAAVFFKDIASMEINSHRYMPSPVKPVSARVCKVADMADIDRAGGIGVLQDL